MTALAPRVPRPSLRLWHVVARNFLVWRKLIWPSLAGLLIDPAVALFGIGLGIGSMVGDVSENMPYIVFVASGMAAYSVSMTSSFEALYSAFSRMHVQRTWESILCAPMTLDDVFLGEWVWATLKSAISATAMLAVVVAFGYVPVTQLPLLMPFLLLGGLSLSAIALSVNALGHSYDFFSFYFSLFLTPMVMLSGLFFPRDVLPGPLFAISEWLPMTQLLKLVRPIALGEWPDEFLGPVAYLVVVAAAFIVLAYSLTHRRLVK